MVSWRYWPGSCGESEVDCPNFGICQAELLHLALKARHLNACLIVAGGQSTHCELATPVGSGLEQSSCIKVLNRNSRSSYGGAFHIGYCTLNSSGIVLSYGGLHRQKERAPDHDRQ